PADLSPTVLFSSASAATRLLHSFPTRRSSDLLLRVDGVDLYANIIGLNWNLPGEPSIDQHHQFDVSSPSKRLSSVHSGTDGSPRSEEHTSELQSRENLVCRLLLEKKKATETQS